MKRSYEQLLFFQKDAGKMQISFYTILNVIM